MSQLLISVKVVGMKGPVFQPLVIELDERSSTVRNLLASIVRQQVGTFAQRQESRRLLQILTEKQIAEGRQTGRFFSGGSDLQQTVDVNEAIEAACLAFRDGFFYFFLDNVQLTDLNESVDTTRIREALFVRLVPLAGG
jgi:hypothetical protein